MPECSNCIALVGSISFCSLLGKPLPSVQDLQKMVNEISEISCDDDFPPSLNKGETQDSSAQPRKRQRSCSLDSDQSNQDEQIGETTADENNALLAMNAVSDDLLTHIRDLVGASIQAYPMCWMVRLTVLDCFLMSYATNRLTFSGPLLLENVDALFALIPDRRTSQLVRQLIEHERLLPFMFLLRSCIVVLEKSQSYQASQQDSFLQSLIRNAIARNEEQVLAMIANFLRTHKKSPCTLDAWQALRALIPPHLYSPMLALWQPSAWSYSLSPSISSLMNKGIMVFLPRGVKNVATAVRHIILNAIRGAENKVKGQTMDEKAENKVKSSEPPSSSGFVSDSSARSAAVTMNHGQNIIPNSSVVPETAQRSQVGVGNHRNQAEATMRPSSLNVTPPSLHRITVPVSAFQPRPPSTGIQMPPHPPLLSFPVGAASQSFAVPPPTVIDLTAVTPKVTAQQTIPSAPPVPYIIVNQQMPAPTVVPSHPASNFLKQRFHAAVSAVPLEYFRGNVFERDRLLRCVSYRTCTGNQPLTEVANALASENHTDPNWIYAWRTIMSSCIKRDKEAFDKYIARFYGPRTLPPALSGDVFLRSHQRFPQYGISSRVLTVFPMQHTPLPPQRGEKLVYPLHQNSGAYASTSSMAPSQSNNHASSGPVHVPILPNKLPDVCSLGALTNTSLGTLPIIGGLTRPIAGEKDSNNNPPAGNPIPNQHYISFNKPPLSPHANTAPSSHQQFTVSTNTTEQLPSAVMATSHSVQQPDPTVTTSANTELNTSEPPAKRWRVTW